MTEPSTLPSEVGSALSLQELAHSWEQTPLSVDQANYWSLLVTSAVNHATHLQLTWALAIQDGEAWELDWYVQRMRAMEFLGNTVVDTLCRIQKMHDRVRETHSESYDLSQAATVDANRRAVVEIVNKARKILARLEQPVPLVDYEKIAKSRKEFGLGQGEFLDDIIARVTAGGDLVKE